MSDYTTQDGPGWRRRSGYESITMDERAAMRARCRAAYARMRANEAMLAQEAEQALAAASPAPKRLPVGRARGGLPVLAMVALGLFVAWVIVKVVPVLWALANWEWFYI